MKLALFSLCFAYAAATDCVETWQGIYDDVMTVSAMPDEPIPDGGALRNLLISQGNLP